MLYTSFEVHIIKEIIHATVGRINVISVTSFVSIYPLCFTKYIKPNTIPNIRICDKTINTALVIILSHDQSFILPSSLSIHSSSLSFILVCVLRKTNHFGLLVCHLWVHHNSCNDNVAQSFFVYPYCIVSSINSA